MEHASVYLEKFKRFGFKDQILKEAIISVINELFDEEFEKKDIYINDGNVRLGVSGVLKSEIFINKSKIQDMVIEKINDPKNPVYDLK